MAHRDDPRNSAGAREVERSETRMSGVLSLWLLSLCTSKEKVTRRKGETGRKDDGENNYVHNSFILLSSKRFELGGVDMSSNEEWQPVIREVHLFGGARAINYMEPLVNIVPDTVSGKTARFRLSGFGSLFKELRDLNMGIVGCDFFTHSIEVEGISPPQWRTKCLVNPSWLCTDQGHEWSFIAHSAFKQKNGIFFDMASRISHQLRACEWRLRQLSESYRDQLGSTLKSKSFDEGRRFSNGYTSLCYLAFQSFLVEVCILRDYLSEFYWVSNFEKAVGDKKITTLGGLLKEWRKNPPSDKLGKEIKASACLGGWLFELGAYRDLVVHSAPLAQADRALFAVCHSSAMPQGERLPGIKLPIPNNPFEISGGRSSGRYFSDPELNFARFSNALEDVDSVKDALQYAHLSMQLISALSKSVSDISPVRPEVPMLTAKDILGGVKVTREGL
ncbi:hypothetical protein [Pseudomonas sp.]|uniref:hypothetical protein n=1 Tax=Pseudomonas sp. TaxID=306 RepID=UPI002737263D|nr:hypothetical protein [Pseudomonas sp.]MDP2748943.1 hypothetical protein [Pseudomonas sp.]